MYYAAIKPYIYMLRDKFVGINKLDTFFLSLAFILIIQPITQDKGQRVKIFMLSAMVNLITLADFVLWSTRIRQKFQARQHCGLLSKKLKKKLHMLLVSYCIKNYSGNYSFLKEGVGAFPLRKRASHSINKKGSQQCKQAWMRSAAQAVCSSLNQQLQFSMVTIDNGVKKRKGRGTDVIQRHK
jgi:hypothetical protein